MSDSFVFRAEILEWNFYNTGHFSPFPHDLFLLFSREREGSRIFPLPPPVEFDITGRGNRYQFYCKFSVSTILNTQLSFPSTTFSVFSLRLPLSLSLSRFFILHTNTPYHHPVHPDNNHVLAEFAIFMRIFLWIREIFFSRGYWINISLSLSLILSFYSKNDEYILYFLLSTINSRCFSTYASKFSF